MTAQVIDLATVRKAREDNTYQTMADDLGHQVYAAWKSTGSHKDRTHYERDTETGTMVPTVYAEDDGA